MLNTEVWWLWFIPLFWPVVSEIKRGPFHKNGRLQLSPKPFLKIFFLSNRDWVSSLTHRLRVHCFVAHRLLYSFPLLLLLAKNKHLGIYLEINSSSNTCFINFEKKKLRLFWNGERCFRFPRESWMTHISPFVLRFFLFSPQDEGALSL